MEKELLHHLENQDFYSNDYFYIVPDKCTECEGFHDEPQCVSVCPVDSVLKIED